MLMSEGEVPTRTKIVSAPNRSCGLVGGVVASASRIALAIAVTFTALTLAPGHAFAQAVVGSISALTGEVTLVRGGSSSKAIQGANIDLDDRLTTGPGSALTVTLSDGSRLEVSESSTIVIDGAVAAPKAATGGGTSVFLLGGVLKSFVNNAGGPNKFQVHTPNAVAAVRGTIFTVEYHSAQPPPPP